MVTAARHQVLAERSEQGCVCCFHAGRQEPAVGDESWVPRHFVLPNSWVTAAICNWNINRVGYVVAIGTIGTLAEWGTL